MPDARMQFEVGVNDTAVDALEKRIDELTNALEQKHELNLDTTKVESTLTRIKDLLKTAITFDSIGKVGDFLGGIEEKGSELAQTMRNLEAQTGLYGEALNEVKAQGVDAFRTGVGESVAEATAIIGKAKQQLGDFLDPQGLNDFVTRMAGVSKAMGVDTGEGIEKSRTAIKAWGLEGAAAGDLVALGLQKAVTPSNDFLDTLSEYSPLMKEAGFSAEDFTGRLIKGAEAGAFSLDKVADAAKETQIRLKAGDITTALADISSPITATIAGIVKAGEQGKKSTKEVLTESADAIEQAFDAGKISETVRSKLQVALSGTPAEELGTELYSRVFAAPIDASVISDQASTAGAAMTKAIASQNVFETMLKDAKAFGEQAAGAVAPFISGAGSMLQTVGKMGPAITLVKDNMSALKGVTSAFGGGITQFLTNPWTLAAAAGVGLGLVIERLIVTKSEQLQIDLEAGQAQLRSIDIQKKQLSATIEQTKQIPALAREYGQLATKEKLTADEQHRITDLSIKLNAVQPGLVKTTGAYADSLGAVKLQAAQTQQNLARMQTQMIALSKQSEEIAARNRAIQAQILREQFLTGLFSAAANAGSVLENILGGVGKGVEALGNVKELMDGIFNAKTAEDIRDRIGKLQINIADAVTKKALGGPEQQQLAALLSQLESILTAKFKKIETNVTTTGTKIGTDLGTGITTAVEQSLLTGIAGFDQIMAEKFERELFERIYGTSGILARGRVFAQGEADKFQATEDQLRQAALANAANELQINLARLENDRLRIQKEFEVREKAFDDQLFTKDAKGKRVAQKLTAEARSQLEQSLDELRVQMTGSKDGTGTGGKLGQITKDIEAAHRQWELSLSAPIKVHTEFLFEIPELPPLVPPPEKIKDQGEQVADALLASLGDINTKVREHLAAAFGIADTERIEGELATLKREEAALALSAQRKGEISRDDAARRIALAEQIADKEEELARRTTDAWSIARVTIGGFFESIRDTYTKSFDDTIAKVKEGNAAIGDTIDDAILMMSGATVRAIAMQEDAGQAILETAFHILESMVPIWSAQILAGSLATPQSIITAGGAGLTQWTILTALIEAAVQGAKIAIGLWEGDVGIDPATYPGGAVGIPGDYSRRDSILAWIAAGESVMTREATAHNRSLLTDINLYPNLDWADVLTRARHEELQAFVAAEARQYMAQHHATVALAAEAVRRTDDMNALVVKGQRTLTAQMESLTAAVRDGIPVHGQSTIRSGDIHAAIETAQRRHNRIS